MRMIFVFLVIASQTLSAQEWTDIAMYDSNGYFVKATSELKGSNQDDGWFNQQYGVLNLIDGDFTTAWVEGVPGYGIGQSVFISLPHNCQSISLHAGYGKNQTLYNQNSRVKRLKLTCHVAINPTGYTSEVAMIFKTQKFSKEYHLDLQDVNNLQTFTFPFSQIELCGFKEQVKEMYQEQFEKSIYLVTAILQLEIVDVYKGTKYDDTCISELFFNDTFVADYRNQLFDKVLNVYVDNLNENRVLVDTPTQKGVAILDDPEAVFQLVDVSTNKRWATVIRMPAELGEGRTETDYLILNTHLGKVMNGEIEKASNTQLFNPLFIVSKAAIAILEHPQGGIVLR